MKQTTHQETIVESLKLWSLVILFIVFECISIVKFSTIIHIAQAIISPISKEISVKKSPPLRKEVLGFAPYWNIKKLGNIDYDTLTTLAYFSIPINANGTFDTTSTGYQTFITPDAQHVFQLTHDHDKRVAMTLTMMDNTTIEQFLADPWAQIELIDEAKQLMRGYSVDGFNIDVEYTGAPDPIYREAFSQFVQKFTDTMHKANGDAQVTVSVYASAVKYYKLYDIAALGKSSDAVFMMAYDFATTGATQAMPTAPLYGYKTGKYWYDVSTAVDDFLAFMPANKLILGVPYYGYSYAVSNPQDKASVIRNRYTGSYAQTYTSTQTDIVQATDTYKSGWDEEGKVGWKAYKVSPSVWRMVYIEDISSLSEKYQFAKNKNLAGVGIWALGFDSDRPELWDLLRTSFTSMLADSSK